MKKLIYLLASFLFLFSLPHFSQVFAYEILSFDSHIRIEKNRKLTINEVIKVDFPQMQHGIFRVIPTHYSVDGKTINSRFKLISVVDENGSAIPYETSRVNQSIQIKIGDPEVYVTGDKTYKIAYEVANILQKYGENYELYWNVTGSEWDSRIYLATANVESPYASIIETKCYSGEVGSSNMCFGGTMAGDAKNARFDAHEVDWGEDFTIVAKLDKNNELLEPTNLENLMEFVYANWGYPLSIAPFLFVFYFWYKKGRDLKFVGDNVYYTPDNAKVETKSIFEREFLPMVYYPINGYSPAQIGTIIDEKVDIHDVVSEIIELARLGQIKIEKIEKKKLFGKKVDYAFTRLTNKPLPLKNYQDYLLAKIFEQKEHILLSELKNKFYIHLNDFKEKLYESLKKGGEFDGNPDKVRGTWVGISIILLIFTFITVISFVESTANFWPFLSFVVFAIPTFFLAFKMPRRTPLGYSIYRQTAGLAYYLKSGKWRQEINEKRLFFEEMLPLAISLEVVKQLAGDMKELGVKPPSYFVGAHTSTLNSDIMGFRNAASSTFVSAPGGKWSGSSSWSGGSGFSGGGSSGGGFGGGGGGSW